MAHPSEHRRTHTASGREIEPDLRRRRQRGSVELAGLERQLLDAIFEGETR